MQSAAPVHLSQGIPQSHQVTLGHSLQVLQAKEKSILTVNVKEIVICGTNIM